MYLFMKYNTDQKNKPPKTSQCSLMIINEVHLFFSMTNFLFTHDALLSFSHESQKMEEQVEDIQIEVDRGHNVFLRRQFVHHHASIKDNEE